MKKIKIKTYQRYILNDHLSKDCYDLGYCLNPEMSNPLGINTGLKYGNHADTTTPNILDKPMMKFHIKMLMKYHRYLKYVFNLHNLSNIRWFAPFENCDDDKITLCQHYAYIRYGCRESSIMYYPFLKELLVTNDWCSYSWRAKADNSYHRDPHHPFSPDLNNDYTWTRVLEIKSIQSGVPYTRGLFTALDDNNNYRLFMLSDLDTLVPITSYQQVFDFAYNDLKDNKMYFVRQQFTNEARKKSYPKLKLYSGDLSDIRNLISEFVFYSGLSAIEGGNNIVHYRENDMPLDAINI